MFRIETSLASKDTVLIVKTPGDVMIAPAACVNWPPTFNVMALLWALTLLPVKPKMVFGPTPTDAI